MAIPILKIRRPLGRLIFNMGIVTPGKTVFLIETAPGPGPSCSQLYWYVDNICRNDIDYFIWHVHCDDQSINTTSAFYKYDTIANNNNDALKQWYLLRLKQRSVIRQCNFSCDNKESMCDGEGLTITMTYFSGLNQPLTGKYPLRL